MYMYTNCNIRENCFSWYKGKMFSNHDVYILLISETHFMHKSHIKFPKYKMYHTDGIAHGGTAILIKYNIKHYQLENCEKDYLRGTTV